MLFITRHRNFTKQFRKLPRKVQYKFEQQLRIFANDPYSIELKNHALSGEWVGYRSIDVTGDIRAIYYTQENKVTFVKIGTHHQLYGK